LVEDADRMVKRHEIHMLPVMQNGRLVGIVTDRDIKIASGSVANSGIKEYDRDLLAGIKVRTIMTPDAVTVPENHTLEETVETFLIHRISGAPVVDQQQQVIGVITKSDLFNLILVLTGYGKKGLQLGIEVEDRPGCIKTITDIIREYGGRISSILYTPERADKGNRRLYIRVFDLDQPSLRHFLETLRERSTLLYIVDHNEKKREWF
ncbi:MAG: CBS domain-containing protein, partial [Deltaproteobacteria bacterium]|nr:CBS domain-containing protein [Deltaproteobacteria bacterium]